MDAKVILSSAWQPPASNTRPRRHTHRQAAPLGAGGRTASVAKKPSRRFRRSESFRGGAKEIRTPDHSGRLISMLAVRFHFLDCPGYFHTRCHRPNTIAFHRYCGVNVGRTGPHWTVMINGSHLKTRREETFNRMCRLRCCFGRHLRRQDQASNATASSTGSTSFPVTASAGSVPGAKDHAGPRTQHQFRRQLRIDRPRQCAVGFRPRGSQFDRWLQEAWCGTREVTASRVARQRTKDAGPTSAPRRDGREIPAVRRQHECSWTLCGTPLESPKCLRDAQPWLGAAPSGQQRTHHESSFAASRRIRAPASEGRTLEAT